MICDRCYRPLDQGEHGVFACPLEARAPAAAVRPDSIPGGLVIEHGLCDPGGAPRTYYSQSEITRECAARGMARWSDYYSEDKTKDGRVYGDWLQSGEAKRARRDREEARRR